MTKKIKLIIAVITILLLILVTFVISNILTSAEQVFANSFYDTGSVFYKAQIPQNYLENLKKQSDYQEFTQISDDFYSSKHYYLSQSSIGYNIFIIDLERNIFLQNKVKDFSIFYAVKSYEKDYIVEIILNGEIYNLAGDNNPNINKITPNIMSKEEADKKADEEVEKIKKLHAEFNNSQTTKERRLQILDELKSFIVTPSFRESYKEAAEKVKNGEEFKLYEFKY